jgi:ElaB/YqjD/DUF883 family membrane-anchored ribosome-binding protein
MNIQQLSNNIDQKLALLDQQVTGLKQRLSNGDSNSEQLLKDISALENIKRKLEKSRNIMWQAHELQSGADQQRMQQKRWLGIALCAVSGLGLLGLIFLLIVQ